MKIIKEDGREERFDQKIIENRLKATRFSEWMLREVAERVENKVEDD